jgi:hypothetical protein
MFLSLSASRSRCLTEFNSASVCIHFGPARPVKSRIGECLAPAAEMCCRSLCSRVVDSDEEMNSACRELGSVR